MRPKVIRILALLFLSVLVLILGITSLVTAWPKATVMNSFRTGEIINIQGNIYVIVDHERRHVPNPDTLDALGISRDMIDNKGFSIEELLTIPNPEGSDIPDVGRDLAGFQAFKMQYFPNLKPIVPSTA